MNTFLEVFMQRREELVQLLLEHIQMTSAAVLISICIGIPLGIFVTKNTPPKRGVNNLNCIYLWISTLVPDLNSTITFSS